MKPRIALITLISKRGWAHLGFFPAKAEPGLNQGEKCILAHLRERGPQWMVCPSADEKHFKTTPRDAAAAITACFIVPTKPQDVKVNSRVMPCQCQAA